MVTLESLPTAASPDIGARYSITSLARASSDDAVRRHQSQPMSTRVACRPSDLLARLPLKIAGAATLHPLGSQHGGTADEAAVAHQPFAGRAGG